MDCIKMCSQCIVNLRMYFQCSLKYLCPVSRWIHSVRYKLCDYCAHQTLGNVPCPRKPVVSPIWALVPRFRPLVAFICQAEIYQNGYVGNLRQSSVVFGA